MTDDAKIPGLRRNAIANLWWPWSIFGALIVDAACIGFFARRRTGWNPLLHLVIPLLGIAAFIPAWLAAAGIKAFSFIAPLTPPVSYMGPGVAAWMLAGVVYLGYLYLRDPRRVAEVGLVHLDAEVGEPVPAMADGAQPGDSDRRGDKS